jgi:hypothetical protein
MSEPVQRATCMFASDRQLDRWAATTCTMSSECVPVKPCRSLAPQRLAVRPITPSMSHGVLGSGGDERGATYSSDAAASFATLGGRPAGPVDHAGVEPVDVARDASLLRCRSWQCPNETEPVHRRATTPDQAGAQRMDRLVRSGCLQPHASRSRSRDHLYR